MRSEERPSKWSPTGRKALAMGAIVASGTLGVSPAQAAPRWEAVGPEGGRVVALAHDAAGAATLYAAVEEGGVWRSEDSGSSWAAARAGLPAGQARTLAASPATPGTVYLGRSGDGVWKSMDGGRTWTNPTRLLGGQPADVRALRFDPASGELWAGLHPKAGQASLYRSADGGATWIPIDLGTADVQVAAIVFGGADVYVGAASGGVFRGSVAGGAWVRTLSEAKVNALAFAAGSLFATANTGLSRSRDRGEGWTLLLAPPPPVPGRPTFALHLGELALSPSNPDILYVAYTARANIPPEESGVLRSVDGGTTLISLADFPLGEPRAFLFEPGVDGRLFAGSGALGVWASADGASDWIARNRGLRAAPVVRVLADPKRPAILFASVTDVGMMKSEDGGSSWKLVPQGDTIDLPLALDPLQPSTLYAFWHDDLGNRFLYKGTNGGRRWARLRLPAPAAGQISAFALDERRPNRLFVSRFASDMRIQRSVDAGATWRESFLSCLLPQVLAVAASGEIYAGGGSRCGRLGEIEGGVDRSDDGGVTFVNRRAGLPALPVVFELAAHPARPGTLFAGLTGFSALAGRTVPGVYRTRDRAESWQAVPGLSGLDVPATDFAFAPASPRSVWFASGGAGVWRSGDAGGTFRPVATPGLPTGIVYDLEFDRQAPAALYAATEGGLFRYADN